MFILAHTQSVPRRPQSVTPTAWIGTILASCPGSFPYTLGLDTQPATLYQQLHQPSLQSCQVPVVNYAAQGMSLLETSSLNCNNRVSLASLHIMWLTRAGENDKSEEGAKGDGSEDKAYLTSMDHPCCHQDPALLAGKGRVKMRGGE